MAVSGSKSKENRMRKKGKEKKEEKNGKKGYKNICFVMSIVEIDCTNGKGRQTKKRT